MRSGVGFYGKNTMVLTRRHGSWVVLGTLVTTAELEPTPPLDPGCGSCTRCIDACPTGALDELGVLDATRCLSYWTQVPEPVPERVPRGARRAGLRLRHLPGRLPVEPRRRAAARRASSPIAARTSISSRGSRPTARELVRRGRPPLRAAERRALAAPERARRARQRRRRRAADARRARAATPRARTSCSPSTRGGRSRGWRSGAADRRNAARCVASCGGAARR